MSEEEAVSRQELDRARDLVHGQVCYLQIPAADTKQSAEFYAAVFGWRVEHPHPSFEAPGLIGQWVEDRPPARDAGPLLWVHVDDMNATLDRVAANGGEVIEPPAPDGPIRTLATIADPAGNPVGLAGHLG
jgi:predicted enzyme related to lactoylglutathione lyase